MNTSVSGVANARLTNTRTGVSSSATCSAELTITEIAKSGRLRAASCTPTTFSTALPAIATITRPAKPWLMCIACCRRRQRGDEPVTDELRRRCRASPSTTTVTRSDQRGGSPPESPRLSRKDGSVTKKRTISTPAQIRLSVRPCGAAGVWNVCASVGIERIAAANAARVAIMRAVRRVERLGAVAQAADEERDPEHEDAVRDDRADERGLHDADEPFAQREERDEQLRQIPEP